MDLWHNRSSRGAVERLFPEQIQKGRPMKQKKILVADDEKDIVELIAYNLEREGFAVSRAFDGQKAWELVHVEKPDLVILDLMMPGIPGMDVCRMIRREASTTALPIIML